MTLPRILSLAADGSLQIEPVPELNCLRMNSKVRKNITLNSDGRDKLRRNSGKLSLNYLSRLILTMQPRSVFKCSARQIRLNRLGFYMFQRKAILKVDINRSTLNEAIQYPHYRDAGGTARLPESERFVDAQCAPLR